MITQKIGKGGHHAVRLRVWELGPEESTDMTSHIFTNAKSPTSMYGDVALRRRI